MLRYRRQIYLSALHAHALQTLQVGGGGGVVFGHQLRLILQENHILRTLIRIDAAVWVRSQPQSTPGRNQASPHNIFCRHFQTLRLPDIIEPHRAHMSRLGSLVSLLDDAATVKFISDALAF